MERDRGANVDNEQVDSVLGDDVDRQVVVRTLPLPTVIIVTINISNARVDQSYTVCCSSAAEEENIVLLINPELEESASGFGKGSTSPSTSLVPLLRSA